MRPSRPSVLVAVASGCIPGVVSASTPRAGVEPGAWTRVEEQPAAAGLRSVGTIEGWDTPSEVAKLLPTPDWDGGAAEFGRAVAIDGDLMVVGARDEGRDYDQGVVYVFARNEGGLDAWGQVATLTASDPSDGDDFGCSVGISGDTVVVGAKGDDDLGSDSGSAYVFSRGQGGPDAWGQVAKLTASDGASHDAFGCSVGISGETVVVGASHHKRGVDDYPGSAYVFERNYGGSDAWGQVADLVQADDTGFERFGWSVAISADTIVVGAPYYHGTGPLSGAASVFDRDQGGAGAWGRVLRITPAGGEALDNFGNAVAVSGDTAVIGAVQDDDNGQDAGSAYIVERNHGGSDAWGQVAKLTSSDGAAGDWFGFSVALDGDTVVVGAQGDDDGGSQSGSAYVYERDHGGTDAWGEAAKLTELAGAAGEQFGWATAVSGDTVAVGARLDEAGGYAAGTVHLFERDNGGTGAWGFAALRTSPVVLTARKDGFGGQVVVDGGTAVVAAPGDDEYGPSAGAVYVFDRNQGGANAWGLVAKLIGSDVVAEDRFGAILSFSSDTIVVGVPSDDDDGPCAGAAYIFERDHGGADAWGEVIKLRSYTSDVCLMFGQSVAISGDTAAVGTHGDDDLRSGAAWVFERDEGGADAWGQVARITASGGTPDDDFTAALAISGDTIVASDPAAGFYFEGATYIFDRDHGGPGAWGEVVRLTNPDTANGQFGKPVAISGDTAIVSTLISPGTVYVFDRDYGGSDAWGEVARLTSSDPDPWEFGASAAISGDVVVAGDVYRSSGSGQEVVAVFDRHQGDPDPWGRITELFASDDAGGDSFGRSVSISGDILVVGASSDDDAGENAGSAYVYYAQPPIVASVGTTPDTGDGELLPDEWAGVAIADLSVTFSGSMSDPPGDSDPGDVTNPASWLLVEAGPDRVRQTSSCATGPAGDDVALAPDTFVYAARTVVFRADGGALLADGTYALFACGSLESAGGSLLDGDGDGTGGDDFVLPFGVDTAPPLDPMLSSPSHTVGAWSTDPMVGLSWSGASDGLGSGVVGYSVVMNAFPDTVPDGVVDIVHGTDPHGVTEGPLADGDAWTFHLRTCDAAGNCSGGLHLGPFWLDATPPAAVTGLASPSHTAGEPSSDPTIEVEWTAAVDNLSGTAGYAVEFSLSSAWTCDQVQDTTDTSATSPALADGDWYVHVCAVDVAGSWGAVATAGPYTVDTVAPEVLAVRSEGETTDGVLDEGEATLAAITQLALSFSEAMYNPAANDTPGDLTNPDQYRLLDRGPDGIRSTVDCTSPLGGDDGEVVPGGAPAAWDGDDAVSLVSLGQRALPAGRYTLLGCGLRDPAGNELAGVWARDFTVKATNLLLDPNFDGPGLGAWDTVSPNPSDILWAAADPSTPNSGVMVVDPVGPGAGATFELSQCLDVLAGGPYGLGGTALVASVEPGAPVLIQTVRCYRDAGCSDLLAASEEVVAAGTTGGLWIPRPILGVWAPAEALSARVGFVIDGGTAADFSVAIDEAAFLDRRLFADGFESCDTSAWSSVR